MADRFADSPDNAATAAAAAPVSAPAPSLAGKVAFVTGAASGLGAALTDALADAGAHIVAADLRADAMQARVARLRERGVPSIVVPAVRVPHGLHGSSDPLRRRGWLVDSRYRYARKFGHPRVLKAALTVATGANFAVNALRQARGVDVDARAVLRDEHALVWKGQRR